MNNKVCLVITSINSSTNKVLNDYAKACLENNTGFILAGDLKSPADFNLPGCEFLDVRTQKQLPFNIAGILPDNNYAKKNLAYLQAIKKGYNVIVETDDDNIPFEQFWEPRTPNMQGNLLEDKNWVNVYKYFSGENIWPRGFSLNKIKDAVHEITGAAATYLCPVQQGLADENPDVDAIYRLTMPLPVYFNKRASIILGNKSICPFNSQNTTWFKQAFALLYLPSYCSFRMTDIWRSFVAQRILWTCDWNLAFHNATVYQQRNEHDLMKDFNDEISGYLHNDKIVSDLCDLDLKAGEAYIADNMLSCYKLLIEKKHIGEQEMPLLEAWLNDVALLKV